MILSGANILITGGTGTFGRAFTRYALNQGASRVAALSRDEYKQAQWKAAFSDDPRLRQFLGDVRDYARVRRATQGVDVVIHAAALKRVELSRYNPDEFVLTNVQGTRNVRDAAIESGVGRAVLLSSDKACAPINLYGATKLCAEYVFLDGNSYVGAAPVFSVVRYGNVADSRGSVIPFWREKLTRGELLPITDIRMTRFWMTMDEAVQLVANALGWPAGHLYVPTLPSFRLTDLAVALGATRPFHFVGIRADEKLHEMLIGPDERHIVGPQRPYTSDGNERWLSVDQLRAALGELS